MKNIILYLLYAFAVLVTMFVGGIFGYEIGVSQAKIIEVEKEVIKYVEVEKNTDNADVTAQKVENFIDTVQSATPLNNYPLTEQEYKELCEVVMAEAGGECYDGQMAVAQCILNACLKEDIRPTEVFKLYKYTPTRKTATESVKTAVNAVFKDGKKIVNEEILYFYAPKYTTSTWHETQKFVIEIGGHRFFAVKSA